MKPDPKYMLGIEWEPHPSREVEFDYWCDDDLEYLLKRYFSAKKRGFDSSSGSCPGIKITSLHKGSKKFTEKEINKLMEAK